jgi:hypothetical protein
MPVSAIVNGISAGCTVLGGSTGYAATMHGRARKLNDNMAFMTPELGELIAEGKSRHSVRAITLYINVLA